jgi:hypothetical protein
MEIVSWVLSWAWALKCRKGRAYIRITHFPGRAGHLARDSCTLHTSALVWGMHKQGDVR